MLLAALKERFGDIPYTVSDQVNRIDNKDILKKLLRIAIRCSTLEEFEQLLFADRI